MRAVDLRLPPEVGPVVNVRAMLLDEHNGFVSLVGTYTSENLLWATMPAKHTFEKFRPMSEFGKASADLA